MRKPLETLAAFLLHLLCLQHLVGEDGFEPAKRYAADLQSVPFGHSGTPPYLLIGVEPVDGLEPPTSWLQISCSTGWAIPAAQTEHAYYNDSCIICQVLFSGGGGRIRTIEAIRSRFTVCPLWPLGNSPKYLTVYALIGAGRRTRTPDLLITNQLLYQLSYTGGSNRTRLL